MSDMNDYGFDSDSVGGGGTIRLSKKTIGELELDAKDAAIIRGLEKELEENPPVATNPVTTEELEEIIKGGFSPDVDKPFDVYEHIGGGFTPRVGVSEVAPATYVCDGSGEDTREYDDEGNITTYGAISRLNNMNTPFLTGVAGSGKSYLLNKWIEGGADVELLASTGIAAVNIGTTTIHSRLGFYNTQSLKDAYIRGKLLRNLERIGSKIGGIILDEVSMFEADALETIILAVKEMNKYRDAEGKKPFVLGLTGDFLQLPPVKDNKDPMSGKFAFEGDSWEELFEPNTVKLTKVWRQSNPLLLDALNHIRVGRGEEGVRCLIEAGVEFSDNLDSKFDGTTIFPVNRLVDNFNDVALMNVDGEKVKIGSKRWYVGGKESTEWKNNIPYELNLKIGSYVMILANDSPRFSYANGDCGWLEAWDDEEKVATVKLARNGSRVKVGQVVREDIVSEWVESWYGCSEKSLDRLGKEGKPEYRENEKPYLNTMNKKYVKGQVLFTPLRLAYASSVHKCVAPETLVLTTRGLIPISELVNGDKVQTGIGGMENAYDKTNTLRRAYRVTTYSGFELICSGEHPLLTPEGFIPTKELPQGVKVRIGQFGMNNLIHNSHPSVPNITDDIAWLLGVIVGDGNYSDKKEGQLHIATIDPFLQAEVVRIFGDLGRKVSIRGDNRGLHSTSLPFREWLEGLGLKHVTGLDKEVPFAVTMKKSWVCAFLRGLFDTDGSVGRSYVLYATSSKRLSLQVQILLESLGIPTRRSEYQGDVNPYYQIRVNAEGLDAFKTYVGFSRPYKKEKLEQLNPNRILFRRGDWDNVKSVTDLGIDIPMIDISVEDEHVFVANGIVTHNTQGLSLEKIQVDIGHNFFTSPGMVYVALSRAKNLEGIKIKGTPKLLAERVKCDPRVLRFA